MTEDGHSVKVMTPAEEDAKKQAEVSKLNQDPIIADSTEFARLDNFNFLY
jgi:hypothetical protein